MNVPAKIRRLKRITELIDFEMRYNHDERVLGELLIQEQELKDTIDNARRKRNNKMLQRDLEPVNVLSTERRFN